jgi:hypothetical protein
MDEMDGSRSSHRLEEKCRILVGKQKERDHFREERIDVKKILKCILKT